MMTASGSLKLTIVTMILTGAPVGAVRGQDATNETALFTFDEPGSVTAWRSVNDTVMGGVSSGGPRWSQAGALEFSGAVSLENNGGFASVRVGTGSLDVSAYDQLVLRVRGDGKRYALSVRTDYRIMAGAYYFPFQTEPGVWQEVRAPVSAFEPRSFGRALRSAPPLNTSDIRSLGLMISDKQEGPFRLEVDWIKVVSSRPDESTFSGPVSQDQANAVTVLIQKAISQGAPLFNAGRPDACAAVYEMTAHCIVDLSAGRLPPEVVVTLRSGLAKAAREADPSARAWALREAFDASLQMLERERRGNEVSDD